MTASVLQERAIGSAAGVTSLSLAFTSNVTAGSTIHAIAGQGTSSSVTYTFSDGTNPYTTLGSTWATAQQQGLGHGYAQNAAGGATTAKVTFSGTALYADLLIREIGGAATAGGVLAHLEQDATTASSTPSIAASNASQPALVSAAMWNAGYGAITATNGTQGITNASTSGTDGRVSSERVTTTGTQTATFSGPSTEYYSVIAIFAEASGGGGATGSGAITEGADSVSATGTASTAGTAAITEGTDTVSASGSTSTAGTAAITESADTVSASGVAGAGGIASITEGSDSVSASGATSTAGTASITEGDDTVAASGVASTAGAAAITERPDTVSATGTAAASGTGVATIFEGSDIVVASGSGSTIPAGRHRRRYGVRDGDKLLIFDTRAQANEAKKAIAERAKPQKAPIRILVKPAESVPLAEIAKAAETAQELPRYRELLRTKSYTPLVGLYDHIVSRSKKAKEAAERAAMEVAEQAAREAEEHEMIATILHLEHQARSAAARSAALAAIGIITHLRRLR